MSRRETKEEFWAMLIMIPQLGYSRDLLLLLSLGLAKMSVTLGILALTPDKMDRRICQVLGIVIALWTVTSFFAMAFQCGNRGPWEGSSECLDQVFMQLNELLEDLRCIKAHNSIIASATAVCVHCQHHDGCSANIGTCGHYLASADVNGQAGRCYSLFRTSHLVS